MMPFEIKESLFSLRERNIWNTLTKRWFRRKVKIGSRWVWIHSECLTHSQLKRPSSPFPEERQRLDPQGPLLAFFEAIPRGFDVLGIGKAARTDQYKKPEFVGGTGLLQPVGGDYRLSAS